MKAESTSPTSAFEPKTKVHQIPPCSDVTVPEFDFKCKSNKIHSPYCFVDDFTLNSISDILSSRGDANIGKDMPEASRTRRPTYTIRRKLTCRRLCKSCIAPIRIRQKAHPPLVNNERPDFPSQKPAPLLPTSRSTTKSGLLFDRNMPKRLGTKNKFNASGSGDRFVTRPKMRTDQATSSSLEERAAQKMVE